MIVVIVCMGIYHVEAFCVKQETLLATQQQISPQQKLCLSTMKIRALYHLLAYYQFEILLFCVVCRLKKQTKADKAINVHNK